MGIIGGLDSTWADETSEDPLRFCIVSWPRAGINVGASKVNPYEIEAVLREHAAVRDAHRAAEPEQ